MISLILIAILLVLVLICGFCATCLWCRHVLPRLRAQRAAASATAKAAGAGDDEKDDDDDGAQEEEEDDDTIGSFLDPAFVQGMDDSPELEINPVIKYRVKEEKKAALLAAASGTATSGGSNSMSGVPGALARLNWALDNKGDASKDAQMNKDIRREMKTIEGYISRTYEADVTVTTGLKVTLAGGDKANALEVAKRTEIERYGGRRQSTLAVVAQQSRVQLANHLATNPSTFAASSTGGRRQSEFIGGQSNR